MKDSMNSPLRDLLALFLTRFLNLSLIIRTDTKKEWEVIKSEAAEAGAYDTVVSTHWENGGEGAIPLADAVIAASSSPKNFQ